MFPREGLESLPMDTTLCPELWDGAGGDTSDPIPWIQHLLSQDSTPALPSTPLELLGVTKVCPGDISPPVFGAEWELLEPCPPSVFRLHLLNYPVIHYN